MKNNMISLVKKVLYLINRFCRKRFIAIKINELKNP